MWKVPFTDLLGAERLAHVIVYLGPQPDASAAERLGHSRDRQRREGRIRIRHYWLSWNSRWKSFEVLDDPIWTNSKFFRRTREALGRLASDQFAFCRHSHQGGRLQNIHRPTEISSNCSYKRKTCHFTQIPMAIWSNCLVNNVSKFHPLNCFHTESAPCTGSYCSI